MTLVVGACAIPAIRRWYSPAMCPVCGGERFDERVIASLTIRRCVACGLRISRIAAWTKGTNYARRRRSRLSRVDRTRAPRAGRRDRVVRPRSTAEQASGWTSDAASDTCSKPRKPPVFACAGSSPTRKPRRQRASACVTSSRDFSRRPRRPPMCCRRSTCSSISTTSTPSRNS